MTEEERAAREYMTQAQDRYWETYFGEYDCD